MEQTVNFAGSPWEEGLSAHQAEASKGPALDRTRSGILVCLGKRLC